MSNETGESTRERGLDQVQSDSSRLPREPVDDHPLRKAPDRLRRAAEESQALEGFEWRRLHDALQRRDERRDAQRPHIVLLAGGRRISTRLRFPRLRPDF